MTFYLNNKWVSQRLHDSYFCLQLNCITIGYLKQLYTILINRTKREFLNSYKRWIIDVLAFVDSCLRSFTNTLKNALLHQFKYTIRTQSWITVPFANVWDIIKANWLDSDLFRCFHRIRYLLSLFSNSVISILLIISRGDFAPFIYQ